MAAGVGCLRGGQPWGVCRRTNKRGTGERARSPKGGAPPKHWPELASWSPDFGRESVPRALLDATDLVFVVLGVSDRFSPKFELREGECGQSVLGGGC